MLRIPLDETKRAAKALGGSVNDLFVAGAAAAAGAYHRANGVDVDELRISMPVSHTHRPFHGWQRLHSGTSPRARRTQRPDRAIQRRARTADGDQERAVVGNGRIVRGDRQRAADVGAGRFARQQIETVDFATSNVRGAPFDLYVAGAKIVANYPMGPTGGTAFNLTLLSSGGSLDMGLNIDVAAIDDADLLRRSLVESYAELLAAARSSLAREHRHPDGICTACRVSAARCDREPCTGGEDDQQVVRQPNADPVDDPFERGAERVQALGAVPIPPIAFDFAETSGVLGLQTCTIRGEGDTVLSWERGIPLNGDESARFEALRPRPRLR